MAVNTIHNLPQYICYLSNSKVDNLYSQITAIDVNKIQTQKECMVDGKHQIETPGLIKLIKSGLSFGVQGKTLFVEEGQRNYIQKFRDIVCFCRDNGLILNLNQGNVHTGNYPPLLYSVTGKFTCDAFNKFDQLFLESEKKEADNFSFNSESLKTIGSIVELKTTLEKGNLYLACSTKFFSDMGGERIHGGDGDYWRVVPHSGNYFFFEGEIDATFEAIFILNGQKDNDLFGSPLALINSFPSELEI